MAHTLSAWIKVNHGDQQEFLACTNCAAAIFMEFILDNIPELAEKDFDLSDEQGNSAKLYAQAPGTTVSNIFTPQATYIPFIIDKMTESGPTQVTPLLAKQESVVKMRTLIEKRLKVKGSKTDASPKASRSRRNQE